MAIVQAPPRTGSPTPAPAGRDAVIDLIRAVCVTGVVLLHSIMVGVTVTDAGPVFANASDGAWWIVPVSWMLQVMPLFFIIGGFSGFLALRRFRTQGGTASGFVAGRVQRLLRPALIAVALVGAVLGALLLSGVDPELVAIASFRYSQPLWFLGVFLVCQSLLPALAAAHVRMPLFTLGAITAAAVGVDGLRILTGVEAIGFMNLAFVWLALQQIGFFLADGTVERLSRRTRAALGIAAVAALIASFAAGVHSPDLIANINPPTTALLLVGIAHLVAVSLLRARIARYGRLPRAVAFTSFINARTMTIYLWHMPVLLAMAGASAAVAVVAGFALPEPSSPLWWLGRPAWLAVSLALTALVAVAFAAFETRPASPAPSSARAVVSAALVGICAVVLLLVFGTTVWSAALAVVMMAAALRLATRRSAPNPTVRVPAAVRAARSAR